MKQFLMENHGLKCVGTVETPFGYSYEYYTDNEKRWWHETRNGGDDLILTPATDEAEAVKCVEEYIKLIADEIVFDTCRFARSVQKMCNGRRVKVIPQAWTETPWVCYYWIYCDAGAECWYVDEDDMTDNVMLLHADNMCEAIHEAQEYVDYLIDINESEGE